MQRIELDNHIIEFQPPTEPTSVLPEPRPETFNITALAFLQRFTAEERLAIREAARANGAIEDFLALVQTARFIELHNPATLAGLNYLVSLDLLSDTRAVEILQSPAHTYELP